ncbi:MAG: SpoIIIAC/SpoIIIAD family protein [Clostridia bacterium]|nr:SpoIIIAC/SpoIIIAD family protein [Clostridia bacterium]
MDIFKIVLTGLAGGMLSLFLREYRREYAVITGLATAAAVLGFSLDALTEVIKSIRFITEKSGVDIKYFTIISKVVGIAYISQFGGELLRDCGENAVASKVELAGKIFILYLTTPIISSFLNVCIEAVNKI